MRVSAALTCAEPALTRCLLRSPTMRSRYLALAALSAVLALTAGCESKEQPDEAPSAAAQAPQEVDPPGDIPDNIAFVPYQPPAGRYEIKVPEGWARTQDRGATSFTDKLNTVRVETVAAPSAPTVDSARGTELPALQKGLQHFTMGKIDTVRRKAGVAVVITYLADSPVDPVTNKVVLDDVERYEFWKDGTEVILTLSGPHGADNVDPWRTVSDSFRWLA
jgi:hypothetical protein